MAKKTVVKKRVAKKRKRVQPKLIREDIASPKARLAAIAWAKDKLIQPPTGTTATFVDVMPEEIVLVPALFQTRVFTFGATEVDHKYVQKLTGRIQHRGELDPVVVVNIDGKYHCVDGHHRIAAYMELKWSKPIRCEWLRGTLQEVRKQGLKRNEQIKLVHSRRDQQEEAWKMTLEGVWSKAQTVELSGASEGVVSEMRRVRHAYDADEAFRARLGYKTIVQSTWFNAQAAYKDRPRKEWNEEEQAGHLSNFLKNRVEDALSRNPVVTARALAIYDPDLPTPLRVALGDLKAREAQEDRGVADDTRPVEVMSIGELEEALRDTEERVVEMKAEIGRRGTGEAPERQQFSEVITFGNDEDFSYEKDDTEDDGGKGFGEL